MLARAALENMNGEEAIKYSTEALEINPESAEAWLIKGTASAYIANNADAELRYNESMRCLDRAAELDNTLTEVEVRRNEAKELICNYLCLVGKEIWQQAVQVTNVYMRAGQGGYKTSGSLPQQAIQQYERALAIDPMYKTALESIIFIRKELGQLEQATSHISRMTEIDPSYSAPNNRVAPQMMDTMGQLIPILIGLGSLLVSIMFVARSCH